MSDLVVLLKFSIGCVSWLNIMDLDPNRRLGFEVDLD